MLILFSEFLRLLVRDGLIIYVILDISFGTYMYSTCRRSYYHPRNGFYEDENLKQNWSKVVMTKNAKGLEFRMI